MWVHGVSNGYIKYLQVHKVPVQVDEVHSRKLVGVHKVRTVLCVYAKIKDNVAEVPT